MASGLNEKVIVSVIVYNRFENLVRWVQTWKKCNQAGAELIIIHNIASESDKVRYRQFCKDNKIRYVPRQNIGYDIGAFQDVCRERLPEFPNDWDIMIWATDDTIPMNRDFVTLFVDRLKEPRVAVSCMQLSTEVNLHIRTTGFCLRKITANTLKFPADPITTKEECYNFEHRGGATSFLGQLQGRGFKVVQVTSLASSPLWDMGFHAKINREEEYNSVFVRNEIPEKVVFICPIFNSYPTIIPSLICQTHKNWELLLIHDGRNITNLRETVEAFNDYRITYIEHTVHLGNWGHYYRQLLLNDIKEGKRTPDANYVVITNADNYYTPAFINSLLIGFKRQPNAVASYCEKMVHSYTGWGVIPVRLARGYIDCGGVMIRKDVACDVGWRDTVDHSSDWTYFSDVIKRYGEDKWVKVEGCLFVHN